MKGRTTSNVLRALCTLILPIIVAAPARSQAVGPFTVADGIGLAHFPDESSETLWAPNGRYVAIQPAERGVLKRNLVEDELRVYDVAALRMYVSHPDQSRAPKPILDLRESTYKEGPLISQLQWLPDSSGLSFLLKTAKGNNELVDVGLRDTRPRALSLKGQDVTTFDVRDSTHYAYTVFTPSIGVEAEGGHSWTNMVGTGRPIYDLMFPDDWLDKLKAGGGTNGLRSLLWAASGTAPRLVMSRETHQPILINPIGRWLALSPDDHTLATAITIPAVPARWVQEYLPPYPQDPYRMRGGAQNVRANLGAGLTVSEYVLVDLRTGAVTLVNGAPTGFGNGWWWDFDSPEWSKDGKAVLLPNTYLQSRGETKGAGEPCAAIFYVATRTLQCIRRLNSPYTKDGARVEGFAAFGPLRFIGRGSDTIILHFVPYISTAVLPKPEIFARSFSGVWRHSDNLRAPKVQGSVVDIYVKQGLNEPPVLMARVPPNETARLVWNPNPQLQRIALGQAGVYHWSDASGRAWIGGLYKPADYVASRQYPLVIQTHGFLENQFRPSGIYPTAFAARALASSGILVLQVPMCPVLDTPKEGLCNVAGIDSAIGCLASQGVIDPNRVGIIGFSRTDYHVLEALTTGGVRFAAAVLAEGGDFGYWQYLALLDEAQDAEAHDADAVIGASPFGDGLQTWVKRSPAFNMQKVRAPVLVFSQGRTISLLVMWEPYATLRYLGKPVDLIVVNSNEHILTNPAARMATQGGSVDWFRFWLQGYESPYPVMAGEYRRWEKLCDIQRAQNPSRPTFCVSTGRLRALVPMRRGHG